MDFSNVSNIEIDGSDVRKIQLTVWVKSGHGKYVIKNKYDQAIDVVSITDLRRMIGDGTAESRFGIGAKLEIPFILDGITVYDPVPFVFGTFRNFTTQSNQIIKGLGLECEHCILDTPTYKFVGKKYTSTDLKDKRSYEESSIRYYINGELTNWKLYEHTMSIFGKKTDIGMLDYLPNDLRDNIQPVKITTRTYKSGGFINETTYDKFFILSSNEKNIKLNSISNIIMCDVFNDQDVWEYWKIRQPQTIQYNPIDAGHLYSSFMKIVLPGNNYAYHQTFRNLIIYSNNQSELNFARSSTNNTSGIISIMGADAMNYQLSPAFTLLGI